MNSALSLDILMDRRAVLVTALNILVMFVVREETCSILVEARIQFRLKVEQSQTDA